MIRRHGDIAGVLRDRQLGDADRTYLEMAMRIVPPIADLPIPLPRGRRATYPADERALRALTAAYGVEEASARLIAAAERLAATPASAE